MQEMPPSSLPPRKGSGGAGPGTRLQRTLAALSDLLRRVNDSSILNRIKDAPTWKQVLVVIITIIIGVIPNMLWDVYEKHRNPPPLIIRGIVTDEKLHPIEGAWVIAEAGWEAVTGPNGMFNLRLADIEPGDKIKLEAQRENFQTTEVLASVGELVEIVLRRDPPPPPPPPPPSPEILICGWNAGLETITLCNRSGGTVEIGGWNLSDGEGDYDIPAATAIEASGCWTVTIDEYNPTGFNGYLMLNNTHDEILLHDDNRNPVHEVSWTRPPDAVRVPDC